MTIFVHGIIGSRCVAPERLGWSAGTTEAVSKALDDAHDATTIRTGGNLGPLQSVRIHRRRLAIVWRCPLTIEKFAAKGEFGSAMAVGHEAEVADAMEAIGQRVKKEAADELVGLERHDPRRGLRAGCWLLQRDGYSGRDRPAPARGRRTAVWRRRPS